MTSKWLVLGSAKCMGDVGPKALKEHPLMLVGTGCWFGVSTVPGRRGPEGLERARHQVLFWGQQSAWEMWA